MFVPVGYTPFLNLFVVIGDLSPSIKLVNIIPSTGKTNMTSPTDLGRFQVSTTKTSLLVVHKQILTLLLIMVDVVMVCEPPTLWLYQDCNRLFVGQNYYPSCKTTWFQPVPAILKRINIQSSKEAMFLRVLISAHQKMFASPKKHIAHLYSVWTIQSCYSGLVWHLIEYISEEFIENILPNIYLLTILST